MPRWIEADAPEDIGGAIAKQIGDVTVSGLMEGDGEQHWKCVNRDGLD